MMENKGNEADMTEVGSIKKVGLLFFFGEGRGLGMNYYFFLYGWIWMVI